MKSFTKHLIYIFLVVYSIAVIVLYYFDMQVRREPCNHTITLNDNRQSVTDTVLHDLSIKLHHDTMWHDTRAIKVEKSPLFNFDIDSNQYYYPDTSLPIFSFTDWILPSQEVMLRVQNDTIFIDTIGCYSAIVINPR